MSSKISDERLAEILGSDMAVGTSEQVGALIWELAREVSESRARVEQAEAELRSALLVDIPSLKDERDAKRATIEALKAELAEYRARIASSQWDEGECETWGREHSRNCQCFGPLNRPRVRRLVGQWEAVGDDD